MDTIAAVSTAHTPGAIGIIRLSGSRSSEICSKILKKNNQPLPPSYFITHSRKAILCDLFDAEKHVDQVLCLFFSSPASYTGEDIAELHLHGNPILLSEVLSLLFREGARPAERGEFSKRAVLNGKLDLTAAESIGRLVSARSRFELELARKNVFGEIHRLSSRLRSELINLKAECEAELDFSTEDLTFESFEERKKRLRSLLELVRKVLKSSERANTVIQHTKIVLYGAPNTGKSSLLNAILGKERAITSHIPGTTRDYLSESLLLEGFPIQLVDTAGIRETEDELEKKGIERSEKEFETADVRLFLLDTSEEIGVQEFLEKNRQKITGSILVANKIDIQHNSWKNTLNLFCTDTTIKICETSSKTGQGIDELNRIILEKVKQVETSDGEYVLLEDRNRHHFEKIRGFLEKAASLMEENAPPEIYILEINETLREIGEVTGKVETEEVLGRIFSRFCVGK